MKKTKDILLKNNQALKGKSLIHRCCGVGMTKVINLGPWNISEYYICSKGCGKLEIPYIARILNLEPTYFLS